MDKVVIIFDNYQKTRFESSKKSYNEIKILLQELCEYLNRAEDKNQYQYIMEQFDMILQTALLAEAHSKNKISNLEWRFLANICEYGNALSEMNHRGNKCTDMWVNITWENIQCLTKDMRDKVAENFVRISDSSAQKVIKPLAQLDSMLGKDYLSDIDRNVRQIIDDFIFAGSNSTEEAFSRIKHKCEFRRGQYMFYHMFFKRWESFKSFE